MPRAFAGLGYYSFVVLLPVAFFLISRALLIIYKIEKYYVNLPLFFLLGRQEAKNFSPNVLIGSAVQQRMTFRCFDKCILRTGDTVTQFLNFLQNLWEKMLCAVATDINGKSANDRNIRATVCCVLEKSVLKIFCFANH